MKLFSVSEYLGFSSEEISEIMQDFANERVEVTSIREPRGVFKLAMPSG